MFGANKFDFIRCETETERIPELETALAGLEQLTSYANLKKGDRVIHVRDGCVSSGAGTPNMRWIPILTVTETVITRVNPKTFSFEHKSGYRESYSGKYIKDYVCGHEKILPDGWRDIQRVYIVRA